MTTKGLYTRDEIARMTNDALDELMSYYLDIGNLTGAERVRDEQLSRADDIELDRLDWMEL